MCCYILSKEFPDPICKIFMKANTKNKGDKKNRYAYAIIQSVTFIRIPLAITFSIILLNSKDSYFSVIFCLVLLVAIEATDLLDGIIARRYKLVSEYGAALDPFSDSLTRLIIYWSLAAKNLVFLLLPLVMAVRDITVAYSRIALAKKNQSVSARLSGKIKATVQATGSFIALLGPFYWKYTGFWIYYLVSWIIISVTFFSAVEYVRDAVVALKKK